jgi:hypothetical protein
MRKLVSIVAAVLTLQSTIGLVYAEDKNASELCSGQEDWTQYAALENYFRGNYYDFDVYGGAFISAPGRSEQILSDPIDERIRVGTMWHDRILGIIVRLGRMLPRLSRPMDLPPMIHQVQAGVMKEPESGEYVEFLRASLVRDMLASSETASTTIAEFLTNLDKLEGQTDAMQNGEISSEQLHTFYQTLQQTEVSRKAFLALLKQVIFSDDLHQRMSARLNEFCGNVAQP